MAAIGAGKIFRLGEQKLVKKTLKTIQIQNITYAICIVEKGIFGVQLGLGQSPRSWGVFKIFALKVTLQSVSVGLLLTVSYRKNGGSLLLTPQKFYWESQLLLLPTNQTNNLFSAIKTNITTPGSRAYEKQCQYLRRLCMTRKTQ